MRRGRDDAPVPRATRRYARTWETLAGSIGPLNSTTTAVRPRPLVRIECTPRTCGGMAGDGLDATAVAAYSARIASTSPGARPANDRSAEIEGAMTESGAS